MEEENESENIDCFKILKKCIVACRENYENKVRVTLQKLLNFEAHKILYAVSVFVPFFLLL